MCTRASCRPCPFARCPAVGWLVQSPKQQETLDPQQLRQASPHPHSTPSRQPGLLVVPHFSGNCFLCLPGYRATLTLPPAWSALRVCVVCWVRGEWAELVVCLPRVCSSGGGRDGADVCPLQVHRLRLVLGTRTGLKINEIAPNRTKPWKPRRGGGSWSVCFSPSGCLEPLRTGVQGSPAHCCRVCFCRTDHLISSGLAVHARLTELGFGCG